MAADVIFVVHSLVWSRNLFVVPGTNKDLLVNYSVRVNALPGTSQMEFIPTAFPE